MAESCEDERGVARRSMEVAGSALTWERTRKLRARAIMAEIIRQKGNLGPDAVRVRVYEYRLNCC